MKKRSMALRFILCMLCLSVFLSALTGCGNENTESSPSPTSAPTEAPSAESAKLKYMRAGETYRILIWNTRKENDPLTEEGISGDLLRQSYQRMIDDYSVTPLYIVAPGDWLSEAMTSAYAGTPICDLMHIGGPFSLPSLYTHGGEKGAILAAISDFDIDFTDPEYWNQTSQAVGTLEGKQYVISQNYIGLGAAALNIATLFNKSLIQKAGYTAEQLYDWSNKGEWTFDKFREVALACTDLDNGVYGTSVNNSALLISAMVVSNGSDMITKKDGVDVFNMLDSKALAAVNYLVDMARSDKSVYTDYTADEKTTFSSGTAAMLVTYVNRIYEKSVQNMEDDIGVLMPPKGPNANDYISELNWFDGYCVIKSCPNAAGAIEFASLFLKPAYAMSSSEQNDLLTAQAEGFRMDSASIEILKKIPAISHTSSYMLYWSAASESDTMASICAWQFNNFVDGSLSPDTYYASMEEKANSIIRATMQLKS
ncbi:MAG: hypothetical protein KH354_05950 [Clostridiales bacterium]|nr:hypothetical protein [Clostridiales bacterium]